MFKVKGKRKNHFFGCEIQLKYERNEGKYFQDTNIGVAGLHDDCRARSDLAVFLLGDRFDISNFAQFVESDVANFRDGNYRRRNVDGHRRRTN